ncbi:nucleotide exchange factor GrpE [Arcicella sp. LKC2W]|uniref:nucleotide exchange factor GrpE n=1 Tax=Arcicella sp. LKC2W TaxID=2984198 RepID=UPI002B200FE1|nr:nucleotide exchange factor GrpE [Arcicella sp. LKC2W]MEA5459785.1 nucleotide exchange factor GrpE [Arcicella sp. LKC2W]
MAKLLNILGKYKNKAKSALKMENKDELSVEEQVITPETDNVSEETPIEAEPELSEAEKLKIEVAELKDKYLRLYSDFDNFRKRTAKEKLEMIQSASEKVIVDILPVIDDIERATANAQEGEISEGVHLIFNKLSNTLSSKGLKPMDAKGEVFNADIHEAITQFPAPTEDDKGKVFDVVEKGYYLNDKVIRFAKVVVAN